MNFEEQIEQLVTQLEEIKKTLEQSRAECSAIDAEISQNKAALEEAEDLERAELEAVREKWAKFKSEKTAIIQNGTQRRVSIDATLLVAESSAELAETALNLLKTSRQKADIGTVLDGLFDVYVSTSTGETPDLDFDSAYKKLGIEMQADDPPKDIAM